MLPVQQKLQVLLLHYPGFKGLCNLDRQCRTDKKIMTHWRGLPEMYLS